MKNLIFAMLAGFVFGFAPMSGMAAAVPGKPAPDFEVKDASGKTHRLSDFKGKYLVLEWFNKDCPYVKKHYGPGRMQELQKEMTGKGVEWLTVISSAKGKQGHMTPEAATKLFAEYKAGTKAVLLDENGKMGKAYDAKTTPHMFVINPEGNVIYAGAIDSNDSADPKAVADTNYVREAVNSALAGKPVAKASTRAYGCSVKY